MSANWLKHRAPTLAAFEEIAQDAYERLPETFRALTSELLIRVEDFATDEVLDAMGIGSPFDLLGLYSGVDLARKSFMDPGPLPDMVFLYRRPMLEYWSGHDDTLEHIITHVLVHEIGHHFGLSDADMARIESDAGH